MRFSAPYVEWTVYDRAKYSNTSSHRLPKMVIQNFIFQQFTIFNLKGTVMTFSGCTFNNYVRIEATRGAMETSQMYIVRKRYKQYAAKNKITLRRSTFTEKVYINIRDTARQVAIHNSKIKKIELRLGSLTSATYIWVKVSNSVFSGNFDLLSAYRNTFILVEFIGCSIERNLLIHGQADEDENQHSAEVAVNFRGSSVQGDRKRTKLKIYEVKTVNIRDCKFSGVDIIVQKQKCCSDMTLKKNRLSNSLLNCTKVSVQIIRSRFKVSNDHAVIWRSHHRSRFSAVDTTFKGSVTDGPRTLLSISRKNAVLENVQLLCPLKVTADLNNDEKYELKCTTQCLHNEYKVGMTSICTL